MGVIVLAGVGVGIPVGIRIGVGVSVGVEVGVGFDLAEKGWQTQKRQPQLSFLVISFPSSPVSILQMCDFGVFN